MNYKDTVNLPFTSFQMKANLPQREPDFLKLWEENKVYTKALSSKDRNKSYVLHDGPPYANGHIHIGHALNKILKDIVVKHKLFSGYYSPFIPGWDCHGLPIELQVTKNLGPKAKQVPKIEIRKLSREYAQKFIDIQREEFKRLGVFGLWDKPYLTMSKEYEVNIARLLVELYDKGVIYRGYKPIHWCFSCETALAEAEIEYYEKESPSIYVKFPVVDFASKTLEKLKNKKLYVLIWTTTPWTLPGNTGLAFNDKLKYVVFSFEGNEEYYISAKVLLEEISAKVSKNVLEVFDLTLEDIKSLKVKHPFLERESKVVFGEHVTSDTGTGIVHTAPGHGVEDYEVGVKEGLEILSPVNDQGRFTEEVEMWKGMNVFEANKHIIEYLDSIGLLLKYDSYRHQYPHCWRCKNPVIFRSKPQWFFRVSSEEIKNVAIKSINKVRWIPEWGKNRIEKMVENRSDWCLSRQRAWGVPIPAIYCKKNGRVFLGGEWGKHIISIFEKEGVDVWFTKELKELIDESFIKDKLGCKDCSVDDFEKETDIVDVWFDSGVSSICVVETREELSSPADMYLEGSDQHRGWFQSSLWPYVVLRGTAPYKEVLTHGFVLDEQGRAMHKSLGNVIAPEEIIKKYGAEILRLWVTSEDYTQDLRIGTHLLEKVVDAYRKIRNTFRYMLGNLYDFTEKDIVDYSKLTEIDKWVLDRVYSLSKEITKYYDNYEFNKVYRAVYDLCNVELSAFYFDVLKDRLYTSKKDGLKRRSTQTAIYYIMNWLVRAVAPILSFTAEDVWQNFFRERTGIESVFLVEYYKPKEEWNNPEIREDFKKIIQIRDVALKALEIARREKLIDSSLEAKLYININNDDFSKVIEKYSENLWELLIVSQVEIKKFDSDAKHSENGIEVSVVRAEGEKCERCWIYSTTVGKSKEHPTVCSKCVDALS